MFFLIGNAFLSANTPARNSKNTAREVHSTWIFCAFWRQETSRLGRNCDAGVCTIAGMSGWYYSELGKTKEFFSRKNKLWFKKHVGTRH